MEGNVSTEISIFATLALGFVLGLKHAIEADHLAAVSTIVAERKNLFSSTIVGGFWGVGHTITLLIIGALVIFLKLQISESLEAKLEAAVGVMLVVLGLNALRKLWKKEKIHVHSHAHEGREHTHIHAHENENAEETHHYLRFSPRAILVGMVHGVAGSAALMLFIIPTIKSPALALLYILIFGFGSIAGMMLMSLLIGLPLHLTAQRFGILNKGILALAGVFSLALGAFIVYEKLIA